MSNTDTKTAARTSRYFAVSGGRLHCESCGHRNQTQHAAGHLGRSINPQMVELDGMTPEEVVAQYGAACCSHCFGQEGTEGRKLTQTQIEDLNGTTARRAALFAESARAANAHTPEMDAALMAFYPAHDADDHAAAEPLYFAMIALKPAGGYCTRSRYVYLTTGLSLNEWLQAGKPATKQS